MIKPNANAILSAMSRKGFKSQRSLARGAGLSQAAVSRACRGGNLYASTAQKLASALGCRLSTIGAPVGKHKGAAGEPICVPEVDAILITRDSSGRWSNTTRAVIVDAEPGMALLRLEE